MNKSMVHKITYLAMMMMVIPFMVNAQTISKTDILKQMKQFGFSDEVTAAAVQADLSIQNIRTLRQLQAGEFGDSVYLEVINRRAVYASEQILELVDLGKSGFSDKLVIAALPKSEGASGTTGTDTAGAPGTPVATAPKRKSDFSNVSASQQPEKEITQKITDPNSMLFPDKADNFSVHIVGDFENEGYSEGMDAGGFGLAISGMKQTSENQGSFYYFSGFGFYMSMDEDGYIFDNTTSTTNMYWGRNFYLANGLKKDIAGEIINRGLSVAVGPLYGLGYTSIIGYTISSYGYGSTYTSTSTDIDGNIFSLLLGGRAWAEVPIIPGTLYATGLGDMYMSMQSGTITTTVEIDGNETENETTIDDTYFTPNYSFDLVLYPSQALPKLKFTLGTLLRIMNDEDSYTMYTFGITWSSGPLYSSRDIGITRQ